MAGVAPCATQRPEAQLAFAGQSLDELHMKGGGTQPPKKPRDHPANTKKRRKGGMSLGVMG
jgi:hypothetical protein